MWVSKWLGRRSAFSTSRSSCNSQSQLYSIPAASPAMGRPHLLGSPGIRRYVGVFMSAWNCELWGVECKKKGTGFLARPELEVCKHHKRDDLLQIGKSWWVGSLRSWQHLLWHILGCTTLFLMSRGFRICMALESVQCWVTAGRCWNICKIQLQKKKMG